MRKVVLEGPRRLSIVEAPVPEPDIGEVLIQVEATAICGTDRHIYTGGTPVNYPVVQGHEVTGVVREIGAGVNALSVGDAVVVDPNLVCGNCQRCILGKENLCSSIDLMGREVDGVLREYLTVPQNNAFKLPEGASFIESTLIQPLSTVVHAQQLADVKPTESVVVLGAGATGLMHIQICNLAGGHPLIAVGRSQWKLDLALQMGADEAVSAREVDPVSEVLRLTDGQGADVVVEAVGSPKTVQQALQMVKPGGRLIGFGISPEPLPELNLYRMYLVEGRLIFPRATTRAAFHQTVELVASGRLDLTPLITHQLTLDDASEAFRVAEEEQSQVLRVAMTPAG